MKTRHFIYIFLIAFSAVSCRKEPVVQPAPEEISFAAPAVAQTKSVLITDVTGMVSGENERAYSVFASRYISDNMEDTHEQFMDDVKVYSTKTGETWSSWQYDSDSQTDGVQHVFWSPGAAYKFFAVYPYHNPNPNDDTYDLGISYSIDEAKHALKVTGSHQATIDGKQKILICTGTENGINLCPDILYGVRTFTEPYQVGEDRGAVNFTMTHALAAVSFRLRNASDYVITAVDAGEITGFMNASDHVWLSENGAEWADTLYKLDGHMFTVPDVGTSIPKGTYYPNESSYWCTRLMIPQNFGTYQDSPSFSFTVTMGAPTPKIYTIYFKDYAVNNVAEHAYAYLPGYHYIYSFNVTATKITCDVEIVPWIEDEFIELN